jgi:hypothetical protein
LGKGRGLTVTENEMGGSLQPEFVADAVITPVTGDCVPLVAVKEGTLPLPEEASPIAG